MISKASGMIHASGFTLSVTRETRLIVWGPVSCDLDL